MRVFALLTMALASPVSAHEFWIEPLDYVVDADATIQARLVNGELFEGVEIPYLSSRFQGFVQISGDQARPVAGRMGDRPALQADAIGDPAKGLQIFAYVSGTSRLDYEEFAKFQRFADHKDFTDMAERHAARDLPEEDFGEAYTRFAKSLVAVGDGKGRDIRTGLEVEIVTLANPYTDDLSGGLPVQLWYQAKTLPDAQIELFEKAPSGAVTITLHRTDAEGVARLPVKAGHSYLADHVVLREPTPELAEAQRAVWETLWASLTFAVPE